MADKKYFWLKMPRNFFEKHYIKILRAKDNGNLLVMFYIWMLTESIDHEGRLRYSEDIPYDEEMLAEASGFELQIVTQALQQFSKLQLVITESDGTLFLPKSLKMIGSESASAQRVREYRERKKGKTKTSETQENTESNDNVTECNAVVQKSNIEKELEKEIDKDNKKDIVEKIPYKEIIEYLNQKSNSHYKYTTKATQTMINGRWNDGFRLDDFILVIGFKCSQWAEDKKMSAYLRPETLFAAKHFESYLNEAKRSMPVPKHSGISQKLAAEVTVDVDESSDFD